MLVLQEQYTSQQIESKCIYNLPPEFDPVFFFTGLHLLFWR